MSAKICSGDSHGLHGKSFNSFLPETFEITSSITFLLIYQYFRGGWCEERVGVGVPCIIRVSLIIVSWERLMVDLGSNNGIESFIRDGLALLKLNFCATLAATTKKKNKKK